MAMRKDALGPDEHARGADDVAEPIGKGVDMAVTERWFSEPDPPPHHSGNCGCPPSRGGVE